MFGAANKFLTCIGATFIQYFEIEDYGKRLK